MMCLALRIEEDITYGCTLNIDSKQTDAPKWTCMFVKTLMLQQFAYLQTRPFIFRVMVRCLCPLRFLSQVDPIKPYLSVTSSWDLKPGFLAC